jgi:HAE1 family hydrophobic/amphiphilic exporter-1
MIKKLINRPVFSIVISIIIVLLGALSLIQLPVTQFPSISPPKVNIVAEYPGANAELMIKAVVIPLERALNGVPGVKYIASDAGNDGTCLITVVFKLGTDPNIASVNVQNRVAAVNNKLPPQVVKEGIKISREESNMLMYVNLTSKDSNLDVNFLYNYADINLLSEIKKIDGVGFADILGNREYAMRVWLKPDRMLAYNISADEVLKAIDEQNLEAAPGKTGESSGKQAQTFQYVLKYPGRFNTKEGYENIILRASEKGQAIKIKDVAEVEFGSSYYDLYSKMNGRPAAAIMIKQSYGSNAREVIQNIKDKLQEIKQTSFPKGMDYELSYDVSKFLDASIEKVLHTLIEAFFLVGIVVFIFLGDLRSTLIPAIAVPISLIGTFLFMQFFGITLNLITLFALVLAIGIVVDDAIVVVEAVHAKMEELDLDPKAATELAMSEISGAIIAITLVMAAVFIPAAFMSGPVGIFYRQFSVTMATSIILSGIVALTFTPSLCAMLLKNTHGVPKKATPINNFIKAFNNWFKNTQSKYKILIDLIVNRRAITFIILIVFCIGTWAISNSVPTGFIPNEDQGVFYGLISTPPGSTLERTDEVLSQIQKVANGMEDVESVSTTAGFEILTEGTGANSGTALINLKDWKDRKHSMEEVMRELEEKTKNIKGATIEFFPPPAVPGYGAAGGFELRLLDKAGSGDYKKMETVNRQFVDDLNKRPELSSVFGFYNASFPQYVLNVDNEKAQQKGVTIDNAMNTLSTLIGSNYSTNFIKFDRQYKVMVQASPQYRTKPEDLLNLYVKNDRDEMVPFSSFMSIQKVYGLDEITRHNMFNSSELSGSPAPGYSSGEAIEAIKDVAKNKLPKGFGIDWAGISIDEVAKGNQTLYIFIISLIFVYLVLSAQYDSFILPLPVILSLPTGIFGAFLLLKTLGLENNIYAQIAMVMLIGILGKNAVLIIEFAVQRQRAGASKLEAAKEGAAARLRPILMTSFAFVAGLIPLVIATGPGALGNRTIGTATAGGMIFGTVFGVIVVPGLYFIFARVPKHNLKEEINIITKEIENEQ